MGVDVVDERPYEIDRIGAPPTWIYDFGVAVPQVELPLLRSLPERFTEARRRRSGAARPRTTAWARWCMLAGLNWRQVTVVRAYVQWLRQAGLPFGQRYVEQTLAAHPDVVARLVALFEARFSPERSRGREGRQAELVESLRTLDRRGRVAGRRPRAHLAAGRRHRHPADDVLRAGGRRWRSSSTRPRVPDLPEPRPAREVWVSSPRVMGIHLRFGAVARGGLRWSDRREDLRTEVLGLVKAQMVKNTVIVPTGAKGGFVVKQPPPDGASRDAVLAEGQACYKLFIGALLSLTDNLVDGKVVPPERVVRHDGDDTYLVVAADKGTATFSDLANSVALERGFWLGRRVRLRRLGRLRPQGHGHHRPRRVGVGHPALPRARRRRRRSRTSPSSASATCPATSSATGCCCREHIRLVAAFDHRHVFVDPTPDAASSFAERKRLFGLQRSSWADYNRSRISAGGGVWPRTAKSIPVSGPMRAALGLADGVDTLTPVELIRAILLAPVDLLFNGGIGTYVKAVDRERARRGRQGQRRRAGGRRAAARPRRRRGRQPRADPARARRVRADRRAGEHRRDRQLRGRRHLRPRGQHQDRAEPRGRRRGAGAPTAARRCSAR